MTTLKRGSTTRGTCARGPNGAHESAAILYQVSSGAHRVRSSAQEHVNFGTSRSHKKLARRDAQQQMEWRARLEAKQGAPVAKRSTEGVHEPPPRKKERRREEAAAASSAGGAGEGVGSRAAREPSEPAAARAAPAPQPSQAKATLATKGRFGGTLAARLLAGSQ